MDTCPYVSEHYKTILRARRHENFKERLVFKHDNGASAKQYPNPDQMVKLLRSLDEKIDQLGEEIM